jgi:hypothetical protein
MEKIDDLRARLNRIGRKMNNLLYNMFKEVIYNGYIYNKGQAFKT